MANSIDPMFVKLGVIGFVVYTAYGMALNGSLGAGAQTFAYQLKSAWGDTPGKVTGLVPASGSGTPSQAKPASSSPGAVTASTSTQRYLGTGLHDLGGQPVVYDTQRRTIIQDPRVGGTNVYGPSDVFLDGGGNFISFDRAVQIATGRSA